MKTTVVLFLCCSLRASAQDMQSCPMHRQHMKDSSQQHSFGRTADVEKRGDQAMGFPHDRTTHHFRLYADGGAIEVAADDGKDSTNIQAIRTHLRHIVAMFSRGDFTLPMFIHGQTPPGVVLMKEKRSEISYSFEEMPTGGRVRIKTGAPEARKAIHEFLRFQIEDHGTGDKTDVSTLRTED